MSEQTTHELVPEDPFVVPDDPKSLPTAYRAQMAFELRKAGASYQQIAEKLRYASASSAESSIRSVLARKYKPEDVEDVVMMELARLDSLQLVAWRLAKEGDLRAIDRILKIMERRSQYLGLDQKEPAVQEGTVTHNTAIFIGGDEEEYKRSLEQAREQAHAMLTQGGD